MHKISFNTFVLYIILLSSPCCLSNSDRIESLRNSDIELHRDLTSLTPSMTLKPNDYHEKLVKKPK